MISNTTITIFVFAASIHTKSTVNKNIDQQYTVQRLIMRTSLMIVLFCTAASLFLVFFYNYTYTKSWTPVMHFFQRTIPTLTTWKSIQLYKKMKSSGDNKGQEKSYKRLKTDKCFIRLV